MTLGVWPGERDWGRGMGWKWGLDGCSRETGACTPPLPAPLPAPVPTTQRLATEHSPVGPESTSSRCRRPAPWQLALGKSLASLCPSFLIRGCRGGGRAAVSHTPESADPELLLRRTSCSLCEAQSLEMSAFCADHAGEPIEGGVRQPEGHFPQGVRSCLWGQILVLES